MEDIKTPSLVERLMKKASETSEISKKMAEWKSVRQTDNPDQLTDLYSYVRPEQTDEYRAAVAITELTKALESLLDLNGYHTVSGMALVQLRAVYNKYKDCVEENELPESLMSTCNKCGARYPKARLGHIHKCGFCDGGYCS